MQVDTRYLKHYGVDDTSWYTHRFGKWQPQAKYANGKYEDGSSVGSNYGDVDTRVKEEKRISKEQRKARRDAKNDYNIQMADRGNLLSAIKLVSAKTAVANVIAGPLAASGYTSLTTGKAISDYNKRYGDNANYLTVGSKSRQAKNAHKDIQTRLSKSTIKDLKLSKEYVEEYSAAMDKLVNNSKRFNDFVDKHTNNSKVLKTVSDKLTKNPKADTTVDDKKLLNNIGILAPTAAATNLLTTAVTGGTSLKGDIENVAKTTLKRKLGTVDKTGLPLLKTTETKEEILRNVNPSGNKGLISRLMEGQNNNCTGCTTAYELRLRGYDVQAGKYVKLANNDWTKNYFNNASTTKWSISANDDKVIGRDMAEKLLNKLVRDQGSGARGAISVNYKDNWGGHALNYEIDSSGKLFFIDAQTQKVINNPVDYIADRVVSFNTSRLDNLEINSDTIRRVLS